MSRAPNLLYMVLEDSYMLFDLRNDAVATFSDSMRCVEVGVIRISPRIFKWQFKIFNNFAKESFTCYVGQPREGYFLLSSCLSSGFA